MRQVFLDYDARPTPKTGRFCVRCQRDLKPEQPARIVRVLEAMVLHPDDAGDAGEDFLIGLNCAKKLGLEFSRPETPNAAVEPPAQPVGLEPLVRQRRLYMATLQDEPLKLTRKKFVRWLLCSVLGWHNNKHPHQPPPYFDGASWHGRCSRCEKSVMLDSQGNWF